MTLRIFIIPLLQNGCPARYNVLNTDSCAVFNMICYLLKSGLSFLASSSCCGLTLIKSVVVDQDKIACCTCFAKMLYIHFIEGTPC